VHPRDVRQGVRVYPSLRPEEPVAIILTALTCQPSSRPRLHRWIGYSRSPIAPKERLDHPRLGHAEAASDGFIVGPPSGYDESRERWHGTAARWSQSRAVQGMRSLTYRTPTSSSCHLERELDDGRQAGRGTPAIVTKGSRSALSLRAAAVDRSWWNRWRRFVSGRPGPGRT
jgi:hypothetical protein